MNLDVVGVRLVKEREIEYNKKICTPYDAVEIIANELKDLDRETCITVNLNCKHQILNAHVVSVGMIDCSIVDMRSILKSALLSNATSIMMFHNHPTGDCEPSIDDIQITESVKQACKLMDIKLLDHIVIGENRFYSCVEGKYYRYHLDKSKLPNNEHNELRTYIGLSGGTEQDVNL